MKYFNFFFLTLCLSFLSSSAYSDNEINVSFKVNVQAGTCDIKTSDNITDISFGTVVKSNINQTTKEIKLSTQCSDIADGKRISLKIKHNSYAIDNNISTKNYIKTSIDDLSIGFFDINNVAIAFNNSFNTNYSAKVSSEIPIVLKLHTNSDVDTGPFKSSVIINVNYY